MEDMTKIEHDLLIAALQVVYQMAGKHPQPLWFNEVKEMADTIVWRLQSEPIGGLDLRYLDREVIG